MLCHVWHLPWVWSCLVTPDAHEAFFGCNHLGGISGCWVAPCASFPFPVPRNDMFTMLVCATCWLYLHLYLLAYMSMHESCLLMCHPCFNTMKLWTSDPNLHLSLADTTFCLLSYVFACLSSCFLVCLRILLILFPAIYYACRVYHDDLLYASFKYNLHLFPYVACLLVSCLCHCMYTLGVRTHGVRAQFSRRKQKGANASMPI